MGESEIKTCDPLLGGFYTIREAARLLRIGNRRRIADWLRPSKAGPVIEGDYPRDSRGIELSFWDLIEIHFVEHFRAHLSLQFLRKVAEKARIEFGTRHPFALCNARFLTDRRRIFVEIAAMDEQQTIFDLMTRQYQFFEAIEQSLSRELVFDPITALAREWRPLPVACPNVLINPHFAYGQPVIGPSRIPTAALYRQYRAECGDQDRVAEWYGLAASDIDEAVRFEVALGV